MKILDWSIELTVFDIPIIKGRPKVPDRPFTATLHSFGGGPEKWWAHTDRGRVTMIGWPQQIVLGSSRFV
jgi:hypothetical protein